MSSLQLEVAREAGTSFQNVVKFYAEQGHSIAGTARLLGYQSQSAFNRLCHRQGWTDWFLPPCETIEWREAPRHTQKSLSTERARQMTACQKQAVSVEYGGVTASLAEHARRLGLKKTTVYNRWRRKPKDLAYVFYQGTHGTAHYGHKGVKFDCWR